MVAGGAEVYAAALPVAHAQVLTEVHLRPEGDVRYPDFDRAEWTRDPAGAAPRRRAALGAGLAGAGMTSDRQVRMVLVAAVADNGVIAHGGALPWDIPEDTEHYLRTVRHHAVLLGRTTYDEIGGPMPDCTTIVLTRDRTMARRRRPRRPRRRDRTGGGTGFRARRPAADGARRRPGLRAARSPPGPRSRSSPRCTSRPRATRSTRTSTERSGPRPAASRTSTPPCPSSSSGSRGSPARRPSRSTSFCIRASSSGSMWGSVRRSPSTVASARRARSRSPYSSAAATNESTMIRRTSRWADRARQPLGSPAHASSNHAVATSAPAGPAHALVQSMTTRSVGPEKHVARVQVRVEQDRARSERLVEPRRHGQRVQPVVQVREGAHVLLGAARLRERVLQHRRTVDALHDQAERRHLHQPRARVAVLVHPRPSPAPRRPSSGSPAVGAGPARRRGRGSRRPGRARPRRPDPREQYPRPEPIA